MSKCKTPNCNNSTDGHENIDSGYCRDCWLTTVQEHSPGLEMSGAEWENFCESE